MMKTFNISIQTILSLAGVFFLTLVTVSVYSIMSPQVKKNEGVVAGLSTNSNGSLIKPNVEILTSESPNLIFNTLEENFKYQIEVRDLSENEYSSSFLTVKNPNLEKYVAQLKVEVESGYKEYLQIVFKYNDQVLTYNSKTGFNKKVTLPVNSFTDIEILVSNRSNSTIDSSTFNIILE